MKKQFIAITLGALVFIGAVGGLVFNKQQKPTNTNTASSAEMASSGHDAAMLGLLKAQTGDAYDTMFITMMSEHHAGAVVMAQMVDAQAPHAEVKALAVQIIAAQTKELADKVAMSRAPLWWPIMSFKNWRSKASPCRPSIPCDMAMTALRLGSL